MSEQYRPNVGCLIAKGQKAVRDAIHVAVIPAVCGPKVLLPGQRVRLGGYGRCVPGDGDDWVGVVDPYLEQVMPGEAFWLFLRPDTVTDLRHSWQHPAATELTDAMTLWQGRTP